MQLILVALACFPFVKWFGYGMGSDIQPYCLIGSGIIICLFGIKNKIYITKDIKKIFWIFSEKTNSPAKYARGFVRYFKN